LKNRAILVLLISCFIPSTASAQDSQPPYTAQGISTLGADGVQQANHGDCWFEAALADLARLPRGQERIAQMISYGPQHSYVVRFPDNGSQYSVTLADTKAFGLRDRALWARIVECAQLKRFPNGKGVNDPESGRGALGTGLHCLTGSRTEGAKPSDMADDELASFIYSAVRSQNPILAATKRGVRSPLVAGHVYSIVDIDMSHSAVILRNPWGDTRRKDGQHQSARVRLSLSDFRRDFFAVTRSYL
jgi:hypothetical protein